MYYPEDSSNDFKGGIDHLGFWTTVNSTVYSVKHKIVPKNNKHFQLKQFAASNMILFVLRTNFLSLGLQQTSPI